MKVLVCYNEGMERHSAPLNAFSRGLHIHGNTLYSVGVKDAKMYQNQVDFVVIFGSGSLTRGINAVYKYHVIEACVRNHVPYVMLEEAFIGRGIYWSVTVNGLAGDGLYLHDNLDPNRIDNIITFKPFEWSGNTILLTKQLERDANVGVPAEEYREFLQKMRTYWSQMNYLFEEREHPKVKASKESIDVALKRARFLVTFSSTTAVDAAVNGVPFYVYHPRSVVRKLCCYDIDGVLPSYAFQREVLNEVAHAQWTLDEMEKGQCWEHVRQLEKIKQL